jgi:serine/threonine-protein kinase
VVGGPVQLLDSLLREAAAGELVLAPPVERELRERLGASGAAERRGLLSPQPVFALDAAAAARAAGRDAVEAPAAPAGGADLWAEPGEVTVADPADLGPGDRLGDRFEVLDLVGTSSAGSLFRARDRELGETLALKVFAPGALAAAEEFERLDSALARLRQLVHPQIARTYDFGRGGGLGFIAREFVFGTPLAEILAGDARLPAPAALRLFRQLAAALAAAHQDGLSHGRLTPRNLVLEPGGRLRVTDFGVSLVARPPSGEAAGGAPGPLAPEQVAGGAPGPRSDVYAAGAVLHRALTGGWPAAGAPLAAGTLPDALAAVVAACLDREPGRRYADGGALLDALAGVRA